MCQPLVPLTTTTAFSLHPARFPLYPVAGPGKSPDVPNHTRANSTEAITPATVLQPPVVALLACSSSRSHHNAIICHERPALARWLLVDRSTGMKRRPALCHAMQHFAGSVHTIYHELSTNPIHPLPTHGPLSTRSLVQIRYCLRKSYRSRVCSSSACRRRVFRPSC